MGKSRNCICPAASQSQVYPRGSGCLYSTGCIVPLAHGRPTITMTITTTTIIIVPPY